MDLHRLQAALEALIFAAPGPVPAVELARVLGLEIHLVEHGLASLGEACAAQDRGLTLEAVAGGYQFATKPEFAEFVSGLRPAPEDGRLSRAALETLAIVAYRQPVTRAQIEAVRGVRSEGAIAALLERDLVREAGRLEGPGRPILYATTPRFLQQFGLRSLDDLPPLSEGPEGESERATSEP